MQPHYAKVMGRLRPPLRRAEIHDAARVIGRTAGTMGESDALSQGTTLFRCRGRSVHDDPNCGDQNEHEKFDRVGENHHG